MTAALQIDPLAEAPAPQGTDPSAAPPPAQRTCELFDRIGLPYVLRVLEHPASTPEDVATALGTEPDYLVLSTLFRGKATRKPVLLLHSAITRISDKVLSQLVGENIQRADAEFIHRYTGFTQDCVPPAGHLNRVPLIMDSTITRLARVWCNAGAPGCYALVPTLILARVCSARLVRLST